jgi:hypothetical protein
MTPTSAIIEIIEQELAAYRRTGRAVHLVHAARALQDAIGEAAGTASKGLDDVGAAHDRG